MTESCHTCQGVMAHMNESSIGLNDTTMELTFAVVKQPIVLNVLLKQPLHLEWLHAYFASTIRACVLHFARVK